MTTGKCVLVVDDDRRWLEQVSAVVESLGHEVVKAKNSREAHWQLGQKKFDLLVTDNLMEHENAGIELLMHNWYDESEIPSILHSSEFSAEQEKLLKKDLPDVILVKKEVGRENPNLIAAIQKLLP